VHGGIYSHASDLFDEMEMRSKACSVISRHLGYNPAILIKA
jgi:hypothetical protein